jgi:hypothetical protein
VITREELAGMSDDEMLTYYRRKWCNPYMQLGTAKGLRRGELKHWHSTALAVKRRR